MKIFKITFLLLTISLFGFNLTAQELEKEMFKSFGENTNSCYGNVLMPSQYDTIVERVEVKAAYAYLKRTPPTFDTIIEKILVRPGYTKYDVTEPVFETEVLRISVRDAQAIINQQSASQPSSVMNTIETAPTLKVWKKTKRIRNCKSKKPENCLTWQVVTVPAQYIEIERIMPTTIKKNSEDISQTESEYITIEKKILKKDGSVKEVNVLPEYKTVTRYIKKTNATFEEINIPAVYKEVKKLRLVSEGGNVEPVEVVCKKNYPEYIRPLQEKLQSLGYDVGVIDGVLGRKTKNALLDYQSKNDLPVGQLDFKSLKHLGLIK